MGLVARGDHGNVPAAFSGYQDTGSQHDPAGAQRLRRPSWTWHWSPSPLSNRCLPITLPRSERQTAPTGEPPSTERTASPRRLLGSSWHPRDHEFPGFPTLTRRHRL